MYSIYHFFADLVEKRENFFTTIILQKFPFNSSLLSCKSEGKFPDMAVRINNDKSIFTGGELIELKDSWSYTVSSFNSTIPSGHKSITEVIKSKNSNIKIQMEESGNEIYSLPEREVYYLVRGRKGKTKGDMKICLIHGSFFETLAIDQLINLSFSQVIDEALKEMKVKIPINYKKKLLSNLFKQENFSRVRNIDNASVKLRFRIMTEVKAEGNILNSEKYPEIIDNSLNLILPCDNDKTEEMHLMKFNLAFANMKIPDYKKFKIKHHLDGHFLVLQFSLM